MQELINNIIFHFSYLDLYGLCFAYFILLYFGIAPLFLSICKYLNAKGILHQIVQKEITKEQIHYEMKHSLVSIIIFGFSILPIIYLIRIGYVELLPNTLLNILAGISLLTIWNEIHFFIVHRLMHTKFLLKHVHIIHHRSKVPTVYSVYSFHWIEALLLSTVPLTIAPFIPFCPIAIFTYPLVSILLNYSGHCNYRFGNGEGSSWKLIGTHHNLHHSKGRRNYGFASDLLDKLTSVFNK